MLLAVYYRGLMHLENLKTEPIRGYLPLISTKVSKWVAANLMCNLHRSQKIR